MPAPSPVLPSASTAPRCQIAFSALMPFSTTWPPGLAVDRHDQADAAGVVLVRRMYRRGTPSDASTFRLILGNELLALVQDFISHGRDPF